MTRTIQLTLTITAPAEVNPGDLCEFVRWQIDNWHPNAPCKVQVCASTIVHKRGRRAIATEAQITTIQAMGPNFTIEAIAKATGLSRGVVSRVLKGNSDGR